MNKLILATGGTLCGLAVMLGAFAAHGLKSHISPSMIAVFHTGVDYQFMHGIALIVFGILSHLGYKLKWASIFAMLGVVFFSGSLYLLATTSNKIFGPNYANWWRVFYCELVALHHHCCKASVSSN